MKKLTKSRAVLAMIVLAVMILSLFAGTTIFAQADDDSSSYVAYIITYEDESATYNYYTSLSDALEAVNGSGTVYLYANASLESAIPSGVTLDVGTCTLTVSASNLSNLLSSKGEISVSVGGSVVYYTGTDESSKVTWIGTSSDSDALIQLTSGTINFAFYDEYEEGASVGALTLDGEATVPEGVTCYTMLGTTSYPIDMVVYDEDSTLTVAGTLKVISGTANDGSTLEICGTVNVTGAITVGEDADIIIYDGGTLTLPLMSSTDIAGSGSGTGILGAITVYGGATLKYYTYTIFGDSEDEDAMITLSESYSYENEDGEIDSIDTIAVLYLSEYSIELISGTAEITGEQKSLFVTYDNGSIVAHPLSIDIVNSSELVVSGTLSVTNGSSLNIRSGSTVSVSGILELHSEADGYGTIAVGSDAMVVVYTTEEFNTEEATFAFWLEDCTSTVLSNVDVTDLIGDDAVTVYGETSYTSISSGEGTLLYTSTVEHDYDYENGVWTWTETDDGYTATFTVTCTVCGATYEIEATVTSTTLDDGSVVYTAVAVDDDGNAYSDTLTISAEGDVEDDDSVQTSDNSNIAMMGIILIMAIAGCAGVAVSKKR